MRRFWFCTAVLGIAAAASAAPNVTNVTQKGSVLIFPDIDVFGGKNTLVRMQNDGTQDVDLKCYWMDGNKNRVDFIIPVTRNQAVWFDARSGNGTFQVNPFPNTFANGIDNPYLVGPGPDEDNDTSGPYETGLLACWAVDGGAQNQVKWNHLSGTATVYGPLSAYEYSAYAFFAPTGIDLEPVGVAGAINLNGVEYDACPLYQIGQFSPDFAFFPDGSFSALTRLRLASCTLNLNQDWTPVWTKYVFDVWNEDEVKFTGAFDCADSWHEIISFGFDFDSGQFFDAQNLGTRAARYRVQGVRSTQCKDSQAVGVIAVQSSVFNNVEVGTTLTNAGKFSGRIVWDPAGAVPEGGIR